MSDVRTLPSMRLAAVVHRGPYTEIGPAFHKLGALAGPAGLFARVTGPMMGIYWDDPTMVPAADLRSAAALPIGESEPLPDGLVEQRFDGGRYFCHLHRGAYDGLPAAWASARDALLAGGHKRGVGASCERYLNTPGQVPDADLETEICIPIA